MRTSPTPLALPVAALTLAALLSTAAPLTAGAATALPGPSTLVSPPCQGLDSSGYPHVNQSIAFGSNNQVYTTFDSTTGPREVFTNATNGLGQGDSTLVAKSSDGGKSFGVATVVIAAPPGPQPYYVRPTVGVQVRPGGDRVVVAAWGELVTSGGPADGAGDRRLVTAVSNDGAATWSAPVDASAPGEQVREPSPAVFGTDGTIYLAWRNRDNPPSPSNEVVAKSTDGAATWSTPLRVNDDPTGNKVRQHVPRIAVAPNGRIDVVWLDHRNSYPTPVVPAAAGGGDVYYASSADGGKTFTPNRRITDRTINLGMGLIPKLGSYAWYGPAVAPLGNDGVFFAWSDPRFGNLDTDTNDIMTATLNLGAGDATPTIHA